MLDQTLIEILANLDFFVQGSKTKSLKDTDYDNYSENILQEIAKNTGRQLSVTKIQEALNQMPHVRARYPEEANNFLFKQGSSELFIDADSRKAIEKHLQLLRLQGRPGLPREEQHRWLRSAVLNPAPQQSTAGPRTLNWRSRTQSKSATPKASPKVTLPDPRYVVLS
jgi:hypothetical protein